MVFCLFVCLFVCLFLGKGFPKWYIVVVVGKVGMESRDKEGAPNSFFCCCLFVCFSLKALFLQCHCDISYTIPGYPLPPLFNYFQLHTGSDHQLL